MKIAINGFGRIGRNFLRALFSDATALKKVEVVALNIGPADPAFVAHSVTYDTIMGKFDGDVSYSNNVLSINGHKIAVYAETDPSKLDWKKNGVDWVVDCSGRFTKKADAQKHIAAGAKHVLISAPSVDADVTVILGVNTHAYTGQQIVSLGSCTTNAVAPVLNVLNKKFGIVSAYMTTVHAYTNNQTLLDVDRSDIRRARAAALNIIPTTTGAMKVVGQVLPELAGKIEGCSLRVPVATVSLIDLSFVAQQAIIAESINTACSQAAQSNLENIMQVTDEELVSSDFSQNSHSVIIDQKLTQAVGSLGKVFGWYDNEWGYSCRLKDFLLMQSV
ncbi:MAG: glyceraldehyde 3-phosphate dehydrogenase [Alteromonas naphthalenivorans]|jgi:glyceraldehyde 3-phosphate dehydrogenase